MEYTNFMVGLHYDSINKVDEVYIASYPWTGIKKVNIKDMLAYKDSVSNLGVTNNLDLVCTCGNINKYTTIKEDKIVKRGLTVLAKSTAYKGNMYFITSGLANPSWKSTDEIIRLIEQEGYTMTNGTILYEDRTVQCLKGDFIEVDFRESQLEYKKFLKESRGITDDIEHKA